MWTEHEVSLEDEIANEFSFVDEGQEALEAALVERKERRWKREKDDAVFERNGDAPTPREVVARRAASVKHAKAKAKTKAALAERISERLKDPKRAAKMARVAKARAVRKARARS